MAGPVIACPSCGTKNASVLERLRRDLAGRFKVVNVDEARAVAQRYDASSIPMLLILDGGETIETILGAQPAPMLRARIDEALARCAGPVGCNFATECLPNGGRTGEGRDQLGAEGDEDAAEHERADHADEQDPLLQFTGHCEGGQPQQEHEEVVDRERLLDEVAGVVLPGRGPRQEERA